MKLRGCAYEKIGLVVNHISIIAWNKSKERLKNTTALLILSAAAGVGLVLKKTPHCPVCLRSQMFAVL